MTKVDDSTVELPPDAFAERMRRRRGEPPVPLPSHAPQAAPNRYTGVDPGYLPPSPAPMPQATTDFVVLVGHFLSAIDTCPDARVAAINTLTASFGVVDPGDTRAHVKERLRRLAANPAAGKTFDMKSTVGALSVEHTRYLCVALGAFDMNWGAEECRATALRLFETIKRAHFAAHAAVESNSYGALRIQTPEGPIDVDNAFPHMLVRAGEVLGIDPKLDPRNTAHADS